MEIRAFLGFNHTPLQPKGLANRGDHACPVSLLVKKKKTSEKLEETVYRNRQAMKKKLRKKDTIFPEKKRYDAGAEMAEYVCNSDAQKKN